MTDTSRAKVRRLVQAAMDNPEAIGDLTASDLDILLRVVRRVRLLGRLGADLERVGAIDSLPPIARDQIISAVAVANSRERVARWELDRIAWVMQRDPNQLIVCLKGCAYLLLETPNIRGRSFADVDLMVPQADLTAVEKRLNAAGWQTRKLTPYDDNYYRRWTHELPPLLHVEREVELDLHHNILPRTARLKPDSEKLVECAQVVAGSRFAVLAPSDIVLHAMVHLMFDSDLADKLRDLVDIADLCESFAESDPEFWNQLLGRTPELGLCRPAYYSLRYMDRLLGRSPPKHVVEHIEPWGPPSTIRRLMDGLVPRALYPDHPDQPERRTAVARLLLYVRSHWLRMPPWLLAYHLTNKFIRTRMRRDKQEKN